jgi:hypothetical protein
VHYQLLPILRLAPRLRTVCSRRLDGPQQGKAAVLVLELKDSARDWDLTAKAAPSVVSEFAKLTRVYAPQIAATPVAILAKLENSLLPHLTAAFISTPKGF